MPRLPRPDPAPANWNAVALLALLAVAFASLAPLAGPDLGVDHSDKWMHFMVYSVLGGWAALNPHRWPVLLQLGGLVAYGLIIEIAQYYMPLRQFEWLDLAADAAGAACGIAVAAVYWPAQRSGP